MTRFVAVAGINHSGNGAGCVSERLRLVNTHARAFDVLLVLDVDPSSIPTRPRAPMSV